MRSLLFVPAVEKMMNKIVGFSADGYVIDLEDSIPLANKQDALKSLIVFLKTRPENIFVRLDSALIDDEIKALKNYDFVGYMLPKFDNPSVYEKYAGEFSRRQMIALVETPQGMVNVGNIAACEWIDALAFGAEDYTSCIGMVNNAEMISNARSRIVMFGKANRKFVYDTPSFILNDSEALATEIQLAKDMGFDGKLAINPKHVPVINEIFKSCDVEYIRTIIERYDTVGEAVQVIDGKVYEKMHIDHMKRILKENGN